jgi:hypothetical protein
MPDKSTNETVRILRRLSKRLKPLLPEEFHDSSLLVDLADVYEICSWYIDALDALIRERGAPDRKRVEAIFARMHIELLEHLPYHTRSLRRSIPRVENALAHRSTRSVGRKKPRRKRARQE